MKPIRFANRKYLLVLLTLLLTVSFLPLQVRADSTITIEYGTASHMAAPPFTVVWIEGDASLMPYYDIDNYYYYFDEWMTPYGQEYLLELLDNRYDYVTSFTMPDYPVHFIAHFEWVERPGEPQLLSVEGIENGIVLYWNPPNYGPAPTSYVIEDGYNYYEVAGDIRSYAITGLNNGQPYSINMWAVNGYTYGHMLNFSATAGPIRHQAHFDPANGSAAFVVNVNQGYAVSKPADPTREGHTFKGWYQASNPSIPADFAIGIYADQYYVAVWEKNEVFTISFDSRGGSAVDDQEVEKDKTLVLPAEPTREGYRFGGWFRDEKRFDLTTPITEDFTLTAYWTPLCPEIDLEALIGEPGQLNGILAQAIGLSGSYDAAEFQASLGPIYPSIQLTFRDLPGASIIFSNPVRLRHLETEERLQNYASRFDSQNLFDKSIEAREINWLPAEGEDAEFSELSYVLQFADEVLQAKDRITSYKSSDGLIHLRYPEEEEEYALERFEALLETIVTTEGQRPALSYARFNLRQKAPTKTSNLLYTLGRLGYFLADDTGDPRLNAELLELAFQAAVTDSQELEAALNTADLTAEQMEDLAADGERLRALGIELQMDPDDTDNPIKLRVLAGPFFAQAKDWLPEEYEPLLAYIEAQDAKLWPELPIPSEQATEIMLAFTDLALQIEDCPSWRDPIWNVYAAKLTDAFRVYLLAHRTDDDQLDNTLRQSYGDYLQALNELDLARPEGVLPRRIGAYRDLVLKLSEQISAKGTALSEEELETFFKEANLENRPPAEEEGD